MIFDFPAGHENENLSIPFGMKLKLEAKNEYYTEKVFQKIFILYRLPSLLDKQLKG